MKHRYSLHKCIGLLLAACGGYLLLMVVTSVFSCIRGIGIGTQMQRYQLGALLMSGIDRYGINIVAACLMLRALRRKMSGSWLIVSGVMVMYIFLTPVISEWLNYRAQSFFQTGVAEDLTSLIDGLTTQPKPNWFAGLLRQVPGILLILAGRYWCRFEQTHPDSIPPKWPFFASISAGEQACEPLQTENIEIVSDESNMVE